MFKKLLVVFGVLCWIYKPLNIGGLPSDPLTVRVLWIVGTIALVGAALMHSMEKRA